MGFAAGLRQSLRVRDLQLASEFNRGDSLREVLDKHLLAVEGMAEGELLTSILLLSADGKRLTHGAAPNLPAEYCRAIDGAEIGPQAGSCGTAAYFGRPVYVTDIASDPLWAGYRGLALRHGLRSCWSTPIRAPDGIVVGTFAIYRRHPSGPTTDELDAIETITSHVAQAILQCLEARTKIEAPVHMKLVAENFIPDARPDRLLAYARRLDLIAAELEERKSGTASEALCANVDAVAENVRKLADIIRDRVGRFRQCRT